MVQRQADKDRDTDRQTDRQTDRDTAGQITFVILLHKSGSYQIFPVEVTESHVKSLTRQVMIHVTSHVHRVCLVIRPLSCVIIRKVTRVTETVE